ncbi:MAG TPA: hypothetical protein VLX11_04395 [Candidatus Acidoferrales bacterium]|nr:hypothetical protein [Candidatus Acidoferrales bacterium]
MLQGISTLSGRQAFLNAVKVVAPEALEDLYGNTYRTWVEVVPQLEQGTKEDFLASDPLVVPSNQPALNALIENLKRRREVSSILSGWRAIKLNAGAFMESLKL